jgi:uncharacterized protein with ATP-grasp and redox domains
MRLVPQCIGCLFNQMERAFRLLDPEIQSDVIIKAQKKLMAFLINSNEIESSIIGKKTYSIISDALGVKDPYANIKLKYNKLALSFYSDGKEIIKNSDNPLLKAIIISALGNTIDFGANHKINLIKDIVEFTNDMLACNDFESFQKSVMNSSHLLMLGDNCGEIVFDKLLIETLKDHYPELNIVYSVRSGPIINDVTMEDAKFVGITDLVHVIEGTQTPGIHLPTSSEEFKEEFYLEGGIILSKGQGNFESLYELKLPKKEVYYLLKAKCSLMEEIFKVKLGDIIFKKKVQGF